MIGSLITLRDLPNCPKEGTLKTLLGVTEAVGIILEKAIDWDAFDKRKSDYYNILWLNVSEGDRYTKAGRFTNPYKFSLSSLSFKYQVEFYQKGKKNATR